MHKVRAIILETLEEMFIKEIGDSTSQAYPWKVQSINKSGETGKPVIYSYEFEVPADDERDAEFYEVDMTVKDRYVKDSEMSWDISYKPQGKNYDYNSNRGKQYQIMATVVEIIKDFEKREKPMRAEIHPSKNETDDTRRLNFYMQYIQKQLPPEYNLSMAKDLDGEEIILILHQDMKIQEIIREELNQMNKQDILKSYYEIADDQLQKSYWLILSYALTLEKVFGKEMALAGKSIDKHLQIEPINDKDQLTQKFLELYDTNSKVRFAVETMDSIEEIRVWLAEHPEFYKQFIDPMPMDEQMNKKGNTYKVYHGTSQDFEDFDLSRATQGIIWFTDSVESIQKGEHGGQGNKNILTRYITLSNPAGWDEYEKLGLGQIEDRGHDGVILPHGDEYNDYIVFDTKNIHKESQ